MPQENAAIAVAPQPGLDSDKNQPMEELEIAKSPVAAFTAQEERALVRKIDFWIVPLMMVTYFLQSYDKGILSAATQFGMLTDLGLETVVGHTAAGKPVMDESRYSNTSLIFYVGYLVGTYPMAFLCQRFPAAKVIAAAVLLWGVVVMSTAGCADYAGLMVNRFVLGALESCVAPAFSVLVTFWWTRDEQVLRTGLWYSCVGLATTISPMLNYALGQVRGPLPAWKPMFLVLGGVTVAWAGVLFALLPSSPFEEPGARGSALVQLSERERVVALDRLRRNDAGTVHTGFEARQFVEALRDPKTWSAFVIVLCTGVPSGAIGTFGTLIINGFGYDAEDSLFLTSPIGAVTCASILLGTWLPRRLPNARYAFMGITAAISLVGTGICWLGQPAGLDRATLWAGVFLIAIQVAAGGLAVSTMTSNVSGHTKKSTVSATTFVGYCLGNIVGPRLFGDSPSPQYTVGFLGSFICLLIVIATAGITALFLMLENRKRNRDSGGEPMRIYSINDDVTDWENKDFRYLI